MSAIDRGRAEKVLYRTAISAFMYYPDKPDNEPGYDVEEDVVWCTAPLERRLPAPDVEAFRGLIRMLITDPLANRRPLIRKLAELSGE